MIKAERKPMKEIRTFLSGRKSVLNTGCGGCVSVCLVGGQREVQLLNEELIALNAEENIPMEIGAHTVERQCNMRFLAELDAVVGDYECLISMACGAGAQLLAERYPDKPVFPGVDTVSLGVDRDVGVYEERCRACGECVLAWTAGICPVTRCAKGLFNGPCGGTHQGRCEVGGETPCAWQEICERLERQGRLSDLMKVQAPREWRNQVPITIVQPPYRSRYEGK